MSRMYAVTFAAVAVTAAQDLFEITAGTNQGFELHSIYVSQHSDVGDAQDELLQVAIKSGQTTSGSGGSAPTPVPLDFGDAASAAAAEVNNTTKASAGTIVTLHSDAFNVRAGWQYRPTPEERIVIRGARRLTVELVNAPADSLTMNGTLLFREIG
jgi:hypothetical protein